jgi:hypothetical protein
MLSEPTFASAAMVLRSGLDAHGKGLGFVFLNLDIDFETEHRTILGLVQR